MIGKKKICPNCNVLWTEEEIDIQECTTCGWPDEDPIFNTDEYDDYCPDGSSY